MSAEPAKPKIFTGAPRVVKVFNIGGHGVDPLGAASAVLFFCFREVLSYWVFISSAALTSGRGMGEGESPLRRVQASS